MKRIFCLILIVFVGLSMTSGCGAVPSDAPSPSKTTITLDFWEIDWGSPGVSDYRDTLGRLLDEFCAQNPEVEIRLNLIPPEDAYEIFRTAVVAGTEPDLCSCTMAQPIYFSSLGQTLDLSPILQQWQEEESPILEEIEDSYFQIYQDEDILTALPFGMDCRVLYYREDYFKKAGIDAAPNTVDEFAEAFQQLRSAVPDIVPFQFSADTTFSATASSLFFLSMNGAKSETSTIDAVITGRNAISAYRILEDWFREGYISSDSLHLSDEEVRRNFLAGHVGMILTQPIVSWLNESDLYDLCSVVNTPAGPYAIRGYTYYSPVCYQGFSSTDHPQEVRKLIKWLIEHNESIFIEGKSCVLPLRSSYAQKLSEEDKNIEQIYFMIDHFGRMANYPHSVIYPFQYILQNEGILGAPLTDILNGVDVLEAVSKADLEYKKILGNYGY